ncbi:Pkinase-domain-containing protein [Trametopsis cervina]|nr:Pkinase-domain-containing protein [Trametopsis cervina]
MLQYSVQLPPLSITTSKPKNRGPRSNKHQQQQQASSPGAAHHAPSSPLATVAATASASPASASASSQPPPPPQKRIERRVSIPAAFAHSPLPLSITTAFPSSPSSSSASPSLPPTPSIPTAYPFPSTALASPKPPRSPYLPSAPVPVARPPLPLPAPALALALAHTDTDVSTRSSAFSADDVLDVLSPGDRIGEGLRLQGELVRRVPIPPLLQHDERERDLRAPAVVKEQQQQPAASQRTSSIAVPSPEEPARTFEVVRRLGTGSYAVVYLVRERVGAESDNVSASSDGHGCEDDGADLDMSMDGHGEEWTERREKEMEKESRYGREYAIKLLSKANLDADALAAQIFEAQIHQSLPLHPNIVSLHRVLDTPSFLLLLLEFVPGEDLFYFLEQARDHYEPASPLPSSSTLHPSLHPSSSSSPSSSSTPSSSPPSSSEESACSARTPPTPSLLGSLSAASLLGRTRLKLVASMFGQMCDAVATCHEHGVFHRDIKPENFIVTDGVLEVREPRKRGSVERGEKERGERGSTGDGEKGEEREGGEGEKGEVVEMVVRRERKVVVKLTDFGLSTTDVHSADMDCGSAPYMSYECRNNLHPTYMPRAADVWSLGIVLINMLYHYNPWTDTTEGVCHSFTLYRQNPTGFFLSRFAGMTPAVADFLCSRVFCILPSANDDSQRASAREFGAWARGLPDLLAPSPPRQPSAVGAVRPGHARMPSLSLSLADMHGHRLSSVPHSRRPSLRSGSAAGSREESLLANPRASWVGESGLGIGIGGIAGMGIGGVGIGGLPAVLDQEGEENEENENEVDNDNEEAERESMGSRSASQAKRRKRGARKGKGAAAAASANAAAVQDQTLEVLASASQALVREISRTSRSSPLSPTGGHHHSGGLGGGMFGAATAVAAMAPPPVALVPMSMSQQQNLLHHQQQQQQQQQQHKEKEKESQNQPMMTKKPSKWKLGFGKSNSSSGNGVLAKEVMTGGQGSQGGLGGQGGSQGGQGPSATVNNVANLIMGLDAPKPASTSSFLSSSSTSSLPRHLLPPHPHSHPHSHNATPIHNSTYNNNSNHTNTSILAQNNSNHPYQQQRSPYLQPPGSGSSSVASLERRAGAGGAGGGRYVARADPGEGMWGASTVSAFADTSRRRNADVLSSSSPLRSSSATSASAAPVRYASSSSSASSSLRAPSSLRYSAYSASASSSPYAGSLASDASSSQHTVSSVSTVHSDATVANARAQLSSSSASHAPSPSSQSQSQLAQPHSSQQPHSQQLSQQLQQQQQMQQQQRSPAASASQVSVMSASTASSNWRSSMASSSASSSAFTRYSNGSVRSVSTTATSVSNASWRSAGTGAAKKADAAPPAPVMGQTIRANGKEIRLPANVKFMDGHAWELHEVPRQQHIDPENVTYSAPPQRKTHKKPKANAYGLDTISERPASASATDLANANGSEEGDVAGSPRKVQKGQINALAKMLSALRR